MEHSQRSLLNEAEAADLLGVSTDTLRVWRSKARRLGSLIGPRWLELGGTGRARLIRYRRQDLEVWTAAGAVRLEPARKRGRPRKAAE